jgi:CRP/FNR family transcriptional regulator
MPKSTSEKLREFFSLSKTLTYKRGEIILRSDDSPQGIIFLEEGFVKMNSIFPDGRELTLNIFKPQAYFPMTWAIADIPNTYFYQAMTNLRIRRMPKNLFLEFINQNPDVLRELTTRILIGLDGLLTNIQYLLSGNSHYRVTAAILLCARRFGKKIGENNISVTLPLTHQDIGNIAGITRETATIAIDKLQKQGLITHHYRHLIINKFNELSRISLLPDEVIIT